MDKPVFKKAVGTHNGVNWHRLLRMTALLLLLPHQAVAGIVCLCQQECVTRSADGQAAHHSAAPSYSCHLELDEGGTVAEDGAASVEEQSETPHRATGSCCQMQAQPEYEVASATDPIPLQAFILSPPPFEDAVFKSIPPPAWDLYPRRSRPLYITHSCYLI